MLESYIVGHSSYSSCLGQYRTQSRLLGILQVITFKWRRVMYVGHLVILRPILNTKPAMRTFPPASILPLWPPACLPSSTIVVKIQRCHVFVSHEWSHALSEPIDMIWYCMHIFTQSSQKKPTLHIHLCYRDQLPTRRGSLFQPCPRVLLTFGALLNVELDLEKTNRNVQINKWMSVKELWYEAPISVRKSAIS